MRFPRDIVMPLLFLLICATAHAQKVNADSLFQEARTHAFNGKREKARELCRTILSKSPDYHEVRVLMARTYSWDRQYTEAKQELRKVLEKQPAMKDAISAFIDVEFWSENYTETVETCNKGLEHYPGDEEFLTKKAKALEKLEKYPEALAILNKIQEEKQYPPDAEVPRMIERLRLVMMKSALGLQYTIDVFSEVYAPRHLVQAELKHRTKYGTVIGRASYANRFGRNGFQYEADAYPKISPGLYAYLNFGVSASPLFPTYRIGAELHKKLPLGFEASLGIRHLAFDPPNINIYTGSIGKYYKDYWFSLRPFITPKSTGVSNSYMLFVRRYFSNADNYITLIAGSGFTPEDANRVSSDTYLLRAQKLGLQYDSVLGKRYSFRAAGMLERQELSFRPGSFIYAYNFDIGLAYRF